MPVSRGDREIAWIQYTDHDATVIRRLRDARLLDPVCAEMADTHGTDTAIITVADFKAHIRQDKLSRLELFTEVFDS